MSNRDQRILTPASIKARTAAGTWSNSKGIQLKGTNNSWGIAKTKVKVPLVSKNYDDYSAWKDVSLGKSAMLLNKKLTVDTWASHYISVVGWTHADVFVHKPNGLAPSNRWNDYSIIALGSPQYGTDHTIMSISSDGQLEWHIDFEGIYIVNVDGIAASYKYNCIYVTASTGETYSPEETYGGVYFPPEYSGTNHLFKLDELGGIIWHIEVPHSRLTSQPSNPRFKEIHVDEDTGNVFVSVGNKVRQYTGNGVFVHEYDSAADQSIFLRLGPHPMSVNGSLILGLIDETSGVDGDLWVINTINKTITKATGNYFRGSNFHIEGNSIYLAGDRGYIAGERLTDGGTIWGSTFTSATNLAFNSCKFNNILENRAVHCDGMGGVWTVSNNTHSSTGVVEPLRLIKVDSTNGQELLSTLDINSPARQVLTVGWSDIWVFSHDGKLTKYVQS